MYITLDESLERPNVRIKNRKPQLFKRRIQELQQISPIRISLMIAFVFLDFQFDLHTKTKQKTRQHRIIIPDEPKRREIRQTFFPVRTLRLS